MFFSDFSINDRVGNNAGLILLLIVRSTLCLRPYGYNRGNIGLKVKKLSLNRTEQRVRNRMGGVFGSPTSVFVWYAAEKGLRSTNFRGSGSLSWKLIFYLFIKKKMLIRGMFFICLKKKKIEKNIYLFIFYLF